MTWSKSHPMQKQQKPKHQITLSKQWTTKETVIQRKFNRQTKTSCKTENPKKNQLEKTLNRMQVHSCVAKGREHCSWCNKCRPKRRWTTSHHTAEHTVETSHLTRNQKGRVSSHMDKSTLEKDQLHSATLAG